MNKLIDIFVIINKSVDQFYLFLLITYLFIYVILTIDARFNDQIVPNSDPYLGAYNAPHTSRLTAATQRREKEKGTRP